MLMKLIPGRAYLMIPAEPDIKAKGVFFVKYSLSLSPLFIVEECEDNVGRGRDGVILHQLVRHRTGLRERSILSLKIE